MFLETLQKSKVAVKRKLALTLNLTVCLNEVCRVCSTKSFSSYFALMKVLKSFSRRPAIYKQCCQVTHVTNFLARCHLSNLILFDSVLAYILHA